ncbi:MULTISPECIES: DUF481 domain-containing protein [Cobetia]|uniref:DUF481 domain-containing protein n=1 Tax=Cobetia crustatorum TaxID=553385 RepID=A0A558HGZ9_9GAMM|nr:MULTISPECIES: DUF481 domain-containing protein [Cobetia]TVU68387.1 DUF481 domain-containing protein [Cobetia crustatorum]
MLHPLPALRMTALLCLALLPLQKAVADDSLFYAPPPASEDSEPFSGQAELGFTKLSGNSNSETLLGKASLSWHLRPWTHTFRMEAKHVSSGDETTTEQYLVGQRERYDLGQNRYAFGLMRWEKERFSGYDDQVTSIGGYGIRLLSGPEHILSVEAGPGYRYDNITDGDHENYILGYSAMDYRWQLSDTSKFEQQFSMEATRDNVISRSYTALTVSINASLALKLSHEIKNNTSPPDDTDAKTDTTTAASILYSF